MSDRQKVLLIFSRKDEKWAMRLRTAVSPLVKAGSVMLIDDSKLRSEGGRAELMHGLATASVAAVLVSEDLLQSGLVSKMKLPALLKSAQTQGLRVCRILIGHCFYEEAGLAMTPTAHDEQCPLDALSVVKRDSTVRDIASRMQKLSREDLADCFETEEAAPADGGRYAASLDSVVAFRKKHAGEWRRMARALFGFALALLAVAVALPVLHASLNLILIIVGASLFIASLSFAVRAHTVGVSDSVVAAKYVLTGLLDETLPSRQRAALTKKADAILKRKSG